MIIASIVPFIVPLPIMFLGLITGALQAFIFVLLSIIYLQGAVAVAHDEHEQDVHADCRKAGTRRRPRDRGHLGRTSSSVGCFSREAWVVSKRSALTAVIVLVAGAFAAALRAGGRGAGADHAGDRPLVDHHCGVRARHSCRAWRARAGEGHRVSRGSDCAESQRIGRHPRRVDSRSRADRVAGHLRARDLADPLLHPAVRQLGRRDAGGRVVSRRHGSRSLGPVPPFLFDGKRARSFSHAEALRSAETQSAEQPRHQTPGPHPLAALCAATVPQPSANLGVSA